LHGKGDHSGAIGLRLLLGPLLGKADDLRHFETPFA
jgi:hypothetical protein